MFGFWIYEFVCFRSGYYLCFDLILGSITERWRINNITTMARKTPNCDGEVVTKKRGSKIKRHTDHLHDPKQPCSPDILHTTKTSDLALDTS
jgi:hypothetical protein